MLSGSDALARRWLWPFGARIHWGKQRRQGKRHRCACSTPGREICSKQAPQPHPLKNITDHPFPPLCYFTTCGWSTDLVSSEQRCAELDHAKPDMARGLGTWSTPLAFSLAVAVTSLLWMNRFAAFAWVYRQVQWPVASFIFVAPLSGAALEDVNVLSGVILSVLISTTMIWLAVRREELWQALEHFLYYKWQRLVFRHLALSMLQSHVMVLFAKTGTMLCASAFIPPDPHSGSQEAVEAQGLLDALFPTLLQVTASMLWVASNTPLLVDSRGRRRGTVQGISRFAWFFSLGFLRTAPWLRLMSSPGLFVHLATWFPLPVLLLGLAAALPSLFLGAHLMVKDNAAFSFLSLLALNCGNVLATLWAARAGRQLAVAVEEQARLPTWEAQDIPVLSQASLHLALILGACILGYIYFSAFYTMFLMSPLLSCEWEGLSLRQLQVLREPQLVTSLRNFYRNFGRKTAAALGIVSGGADASATPDAPRSRLDAARDGSLVLHLLELAHGTRQLFKAKQHISLKVHCVGTVQNFSSRPVQIAGLQLQLFVQLRRARRGRGGHSTATRSVDSAFQTVPGSPAAVGAAPTLADDVLTLLSLPFRAVRAAGGAVASTCAGLLPAAAREALADAFVWNADLDEKQLRLADVRVEPFSLPAGSHSVPLTLTVSFAAHSLLRLVRQVSSGGEGVHAVELRMIQASPISDSLSYTFPLVTVSNRTVWSAVQSAERSVGNTMADVQRLEEIHTTLCREVGRLRQSEVDSAAPEAAAILQQLSKSMAGVTASAHRYQAEMSAIAHGAYGGVPVEAEDAMESMKDHLLACAVSLAQLKLCQDTVDEASSGTPGARPFHVALLQFAQCLLEVFPAAVLRSLPSSRSAGKHERALFSLGSSMLLAVLQGVAFPEHVAQMVDHNLAGSADATSSAAEEAPTPATPMGASEGNRSQ